MAKSTGILKTLLWGNNFKLDGTIDFPEKDSTLLTRADVRFDERLAFMTQLFDTSNMQWYYNYIDSLKYIAQKNPKAYCMYILDLGYVPVVYLPSCCLYLSSTMLEALRKSGLEYITYRATSFTRRYCPFDTVDAWVSKMDAAKFLNTSPDKITSELIIREVLHV